MYRMRAATGKLARHPRYDRIERRIAHAAKRLVQIEGVALDHIDALEVAAQVPHELRRILHRVKIAGFHPRARIALVMTPVPGPSSRTGMPE